MQSIVVSAPCNDTGLVDAARTNGQNAASNALTTATTAASSAAVAAGNLTGLTSPTTTATGAAHSHAESVKASLPEDATAGEVKSIDAEGLAVFEDKEVRHEVLVKINQLAL
jgi:hypothetical protein